MVQFSIVLYVNIVCQLSTEIMYVCVIVTDTLPDIPYNYLIGNDGVVYEGCGSQSEGHATWRYHRLEMAKMSLNFLEM